MGFLLMNPRPTQSKELTIVFDHASGKPNIDICEVQEAFDDIDGTSFTFKKTNTDSIWQLTILFGKKNKPEPADMKQRLERIPSLYNDDPKVHIPGYGAFRCWMVNQFTH